MIRDIVHNHNESKPGLMAIVECDLELSLGFQGRTETFDECMAVFKARVGMINAHRGHVGNHPGHSTDTFDRVTTEKGLSKADVKNLTLDEQKALKREIENIASEEYLDVLFIKQADEIRYGKLKTTLANAYLNPTSTEYGYPKTLPNALRLLKGYTLIGSIQRKNNNDDNKDGMAFVEQQQDWSDKHCFDCGKKGHQVSNCTVSKEEPRPVMSAWPCSRPALV